MFVFVGILFWLVVSVNYNKMYEYNLCEVKLKLKLIYCYCKSYRFIDLFVELFLLRLGICC